MKFAVRTQWELTPNTITQTLTRMKDSGEVIDLTESNPTRCRFSFPDEKILGALTRPDNMNYRPESRGLRQAREAVAGYYRAQGFAVSPDEIFLTASTSEAYAFLFRLLADPQDRILFPSPSYPLFQFLGDLNDVELAFYPLVYNGRWQIDFDWLKEQITARTRAIVLVNPNNPTGSSVRPEEKDRLTALCRERGLALISDEVFWDFPFADLQERASLVANRDVLTFVLGGLSKCLGMPQMKLSWILVSGPSADVQSAVSRMEVIADTYLSVNTPVQNALPEWLPLLPQVQQEIKTRLCKNRECLLTGGDEFECLAADGGWYSVLRIPDTISEEQFVLELLEKDRVFVHPGYFFDFEDEPHIVVSLLLPEEIFRQGIARIRERIRSWK